MARTKFNVDKSTEKRTCNGIVFDSELEMKYYRDVLMPMVESGEVIQYKLQEPYELQPSFVHDGKKIKAIMYVTDFVEIHKDGREVVIDTKGMPDATAKLKRKIFHYKFPDKEYYWIAYSKIDGGWKKYEEIQAGRRLRRKEKLKKKQEELKEINNEQCE